MADVTKLRDGAATADFSLGMVRRRYYLVYNNVETEIPKPEGWTGLGRKFVRDKKYHGFLFEGGEDTVIKFHQEEGGTYVTDLYYTYGQDIQISIREKASSDAVTVIEWEGVINLATLKRLVSNDSTYIEVTVQRKGIESLVKPRWDTNVKMSDALTIDGTAITPPIKKLINLHGRAISSQYLNQKNDTQVRLNQGLTSNVSTYYFLMDTRDPAKKEITTVYQRDMGLFPDSPRGLDFFIIEAEFAGNYTFDLSINGSLNLTLERRLITTPIDIGAWTLNFYLGIDGIDYAFANSYSGTNTTQTLGATNFTTSYTGTHTIQAGQRIYIYGKFSFNPTRDNWRGSSWSLTNYATTYDISATTVTANSQTYCYRAIDCLAQTLSCISDNTALLGSSYYSLDNCHSNISILNGFFLRYANIASFPTELIHPVMSFKTLVSSLQAIHGIGVGYERDNSGNDIVRVEPYDYFYKNVEIMDITDFIIPTTYQEEVASDLIYSELNIGYSKYLKEDNKGLDEFNTELTAQSPIKYHSNKFEQKSTIIGSGYLLESVRRQALKNAESKKSTDYDDDNFFVCLNPNPSNATLEDVEVDFRQPYGYYINDFGEPMDLDPGNTFLTNAGINIFAGSVIIITGSTLNNGTFHVVSVSALLFGGLNTYEVTVEETVVYEPNQTVDIAFTTIPLVAEKDDLFTITSGTLLAPETSYNIRINPVYMLLQHSKLLNSGYFYKSSGEKIKVKKFAQNGVFEVQRKVGETCITNDPDRQVYKMNADITLGNFNDKESFFTPEYIKVQAIMQPEQIKYIINAHRNLNTTGKNYGYLTLTTPEGEIWQCYLNELNILENGIENKVEFVLIKKKT